MKKIKKMLAMLLAISMVAGMIPVTASATEVGNGGTITTSIEANVVDTNTTEVSKEAEVEDVIKESALDNTLVTTIDVTECAMTSKEAKAATKAALGKSAVADLTEVTYTTEGEKVTEITVVSDEAFVKASSEIEALAETSGASDEEVTAAQESYAQLQKFYEDNPDYFGIAAPYFTSKDSTYGPISALLSVVTWGGNWGLVESGELSVADAKEVVDGYLQTLKVCVDGMAQKLIAAKDDALSQIDDSMSTEEKLLVLNDWLANWCTFDMNVIWEEDTEKTDEEKLAYMIETTHFGALVGNGNPKTICLGYAAAYTYLVQWAFPEVYRNEDGSWKSKEELNDTYIIDFAKIKWDADVTMLGEALHFDETHFFNAVRTDNTTDTWYYIDTCYNDTFVEMMGGNRVETDGNMLHTYFLISHTSLAEQFADNYEAFDSLYAEKATDKKYEEEWFTNSAGSISKDDEYYYYVENRHIKELRKLMNDEEGVDEEFIVNTPYYLSDADRLIARNRKTGEETILLDYPEGTGTTTTGQPVSGAEEILKLEAEKSAYRYPSVIHTVAIKDNTLYLNSGNIIFTYDLNSGEIKPFKEYNVISAEQDKSNTFTGMSFGITESDSDAEYTVENHPIAALTIKTDGKLYVSVATNYSKASEYEFEETNYNPGYIKAAVDGEVTENVAYNMNDEFLWSANFTETIDLECNHVYKDVEVKESCLEGAYTESRCEKCGAVEAGTKEFVEDSNAAGHHFVKSEELYKGVAEDGSDVLATYYICVDCKHSVEILPEGESTNHYFVAEKYLWSDDFSECTAELVCERCADKKLDCVLADTTNTKAIECTVTKAYSDEYTTEYGGDVTYTAAWSEEGCTGTTTETVTEKGEFTGLAAGICKNITWELDLDGTLTVFGEGSMVESFSDKYVEGETPWISYNKQIKSVVVEEGITDIVPGAFCMMPNLTSVELAESVNEIGMQAFWADTNLTEIVLPEGLEIIGAYAFTATGLKYLHLPASVVEIGKPAFTFSLIETITVAEGNEAFCAEDDALFTIDGKELVAYAIGKNIKTYTIPEGVITVIDDVFSSSAYLEEIVMPSTLSVLQGAPFKGCAELKTVRFVGDVPQFSSDTFSGAELTVYYPADNKTWTKDVLQNYGGTITWKAYCTEHSVEKWDVTEPSCTEEGKEVGICVNCEEEIVNTLPANGHNYDIKYTVDKPATESETGLESRHCKNCDATKDSRVIPKLESVYNDVNTVVQEKEVEKLTEEDKTTVKEQVAALAEEAKKAEESGNVAAKEVEENLNTDTVIALEELYIASDESVGETIVEVKDDSESDEEESIVSSNVTVEGAALTVENYKPEPTEEPETDVTYQSKITIETTKETGDTELDTKVQTGDAIVLDINMSVVKVVKEDEVEKTEVVAEDVQPVAPVKFTLQVPEGMKDGFELYHYNDNGEKELVPYTIIEKDGILYIEFVATSFSYYSFERIIDEAEKHVHDWQPVPGEFAEATCTEDGYVLMRCSDEACGQEMTKVVESALGHDFVNGECSCGEKEEVDTPVVPDEPEDDPVVPEQPDEPSKPGNSIGKFFGKLFDKIFGNWWGDDDSDKPEDTEKPDDSEKPVEPEKPNGSTGLGNICNSMGKIFGWVGKLFGGLFSK